MLGRRARERRPHIKLQDGVRALATSVMIGRAPWDPKDAKDGSYTRTHDALSHAISEWALQRLPGEWKRRMSTHMARRGLGRLDAMKSAFDLGGLAAVYALLGWPPPVVEGAAMPPTVFNARCVAP